MLKKDLEKAMKHTRFYSNPLTDDQKLVLALILGKDKKFSPDGHNCIIVANNDDTYTVYHIYTHTVAFTAATFDELVDKLHTYTY